MKIAAKTIQKEILVDKFYSIIFNQSSEGDEEENDNEDNNNNKNDNNNDSERRKQIFFKKLIIKILVDNFNYFIGNLYLRDIEINGSGNENSNKIISQGFSRDEFSFLDEFIINSELPSYEEVINNI